MSKESATPETTPETSATPEAPANTKTKVEVEAPVPETKVETPEVKAPVSAPSRDPEARILALTEKSSRAFTQRDAALGAAETAKSALLQAQAENAILRAGGTHLSAEMVKILATGISSETDVSAAAARLTKELAPRQTLSTKPPEDASNTLSDDPRERRHELVRRKYANSGD